MSGGKASEKQTQGTSAKPDDDLRAPRHKHNANALKDNFKGKKAAEQRKKARTTAERASEAHPEPRPELAADGPFTAALIMNRYFF